MRLSELAGSGNFLRVVELFPPGIPMPDSMVETEKYDLSVKFEKLVQSIQKLESMADAFSLPELKDESRLHLNSVAVAAELKRRTGDEVAPTITLRDSNRQNLLGSISYAIFAGIENLLLVRGDPYPGRRPRPSPRNVYDFGKVSELVSLIRRIEGRLAKNPRLCLMSPINVTRSKEPKYLDTLRAREFSGVDIFVVESMFEDLEKYLAKVAEIRRAGITRPIIHNLFPLKGYEDAVSCMQKFGWTIPESELYNLKSGGAEYGLEMARKRYRALLDRKGEEAQGVTISTRGNPETAWLVTA